MITPGVDCGDELGPSSACGIHNIRNTRAREGYAPVDIAHGSARKQYRSPSRTTLMHIGLVSRLELQLPADQLIASGAGPYGQFTGEDTEHVQLVT